MFAGLSPGNEPDPSFIMNYMMIFPIIMILLLAVHYGWFWAVGVGLQHKLPPEVTMKVGRFKIFLLIPVVYILCIVGFVASTMSNVFQNGTPPDFEIVWIIAFIVPLHFFCMFCIFYGMYFVAKTFKSAELQREVILSDYEGEFFLIWFFPIGIWFIQPKINEMIEE